MEALNIRHETRAISLDISQAFDTAWHPALLSKPCAYGNQDQLHSWIIDFLHSRSQHVAFDGILSSPLSVKALVPKGSVLGPVLLLIFVNDLTVSLENPPRLFADDSTLCRDIPDPSDRQAAAVSSLSPDHDKITNW